MALKFPIANLTAGLSFDWSVTTNWNSSTVPVDGDYIFLRNMASSIDAGLNQSAIQPAELNIEASCISPIGTAAGAYLQIGPVLTKIGQQYPGISSVGPTRCMLDSGVDPAEVVIYRCGASLDAGLDTVRLKGSHATLNKLRILGTGSSGSVGLGTTLPSESGIVFNDVDHIEGMFTAAGGATIKNYTGEGGTARLLNLWNAAGVLRQNGGKALYLLGAGLLPTAYINGTCYHGQRVVGAATHTNLYIMSGGTVDCTFDPRPWTMTNAIKIYEDGKLKLLRPSQVTLEAGGAQSYETQNCDLEDVTVETGPNAKFTLADVV